MVMSHLPSCNSRPNRGGWEGGVSDRQESETKTLILLCLLLHQWMPSDVDRTQWWQRMNTILKCVFHLRIECQGEDALQRLKRINCCVCIHLIERQIKWQRQRVLPPAGQYIKSLNTKSICVHQCSDDPSPTTHIHNIDSWAEYYTTPLLFRASIWMCICDFVTQESGGHSSQYRCTQHSIDLCCHWILDWLPSQHMCLTVISLTD